MLAQIRDANYQIIITDKKCSIAMQQYELAISECRNLGADKLRAEIHVFMDILLDHKASVIMLTRMMVQQ